MLRLTDPRLPERPEMSSWAQLARRAALLLAGVGGNAAAAQLPELQSISGRPAPPSISAALPAVERFQARDGTWLGFRHYGARRPADGTRGDRGARLLRLQRRHHSRAVAGAGSARGVETLAVDMRGHGTSGTRGDIGYVGQLEDDLADFVAVCAQDRASQRR